MAQFAIGVEDAECWFSPDQYAHCRETTTPVRFEAKCFFDALMKTWPRCEGRPERWLFQPDHGENGDGSRVYRYEDEPEYYIVFKFD